MGHWLLKSADRAEWAAMARILLGLIGLGLAACSNTDRAGDTSADVVDDTTASDTAEISPDDASGSDTEPPDSADRDGAPDTLDDADTPGTSDVPDGTGATDTSDTSDTSDTPDPPPPPPAELIFVRIEGDEQGVFGGWHNPWTELGGVSLAGYGWVETVKWNVIRPTDLTSGLPSGRQRYFPVALRVRLAGGVLQTLETIAVVEGLSVELLWFQLEPDGEYSRRRIQTLVSGSTEGVELETRRDPGGLTTWATLGFAYMGIGITDYETNTSFTDDWSIDF
jgi:hypothetical protein